jgi:molybdopterin-guanine dinucleotide biosynthesis protein A
VALSRPVSRARSNAIVLAGGPPDEVAALAPGVPNKAFVPIAGVTLVARTIAALRSSERIGRIVAVAPRLPSTIDALTAADEIRDDGPTMAASLRSGLRGFPPDELVLVFASDLPILTRDAIDDFVARAEANDADLTYACVDRRVHEARYANVPHTWARLRDGSFCGGGCVALRPRVLPALDGLLGRLGAARKNPFGRDFRTGDLAPVRGRAFDDRARREARRRTRRRPRARRHLRVSGDRGQRRSRERRSAGGIVLQERRPKCRIQRPSLSPIDASRAIGRLSSDSTERSRSAEPPRTCA